MILCVPRDIAKTSFEARAFRYLVVTSQYRSPLNFSPDTFKSALQSLKRIDKVVTSLQSILVTSKSQQQMQSNTQITADSINNTNEANNPIIVNIMNNFERAMSDDLNTPRAVAELFALISYAEKLLSSTGISKETSKEASKETSSSSSSFSIKNEDKLEESFINDINEIYRNIMLMDEVFGLFYSPNGANNLASTDDNTVELIPDEVIELAQKRYNSKINKQFKEADDYRTQISALGYTVKDKKDGFEIIKS